MDVTLSVFKRRDNNYYYHYYTTLTLLGTKMKWFDKYQKKKLRK